MAGARRDAVRRVAGSLARYRRTILAAAVGGVALVVAGQAYARIGGT